MSKTADSNHPLRTSGRRLRLLRRLVAIASLAVMLAWLLSLGTSLAMRLGWIARIQIVPVALTAWLSMIVFWILFTLLFGRVYCSTVCPMGIAMDIFARLPRLGRRRWSRGYRHLPARNRLRYSWLALIVVTAALGFPVLLSLFDPYGAFARIVTYFTMPLKGQGLTLAGGMLAGFAVAALTLVAVAVVSWRKGRLICNTFCPVGSALSVVSRYSVMGIDINTDVCVSCGRCERACKAHCIDLKQHTVDRSRCVVCFDCLDACNDEAISYTFHRHRLSSPLLMPAGLRSSRAPEASATFDAPATGTADGTAATPPPAEPRPVDTATRRRFLASAMALAAAPALLAAEERARRVREAFTPEVEPTHPSRPVPPPGIPSTRGFVTRCVGCGACIDACPAKVLRPSTAQYGPSTPLRPLKDYDASYCRYDCTVCTRTCPTGAILPLTVAEKHTFRVGLAKVDPDACIGCGLCARRCPRHTITMATRPDGKRLAVVDLEGCIGCGSCQYICPATPHKAIVVNGLQL